jgi:hypothetical protein
MSDEKEGGGGGCADERFRSVVFIQCRQYLTVFVALAMVLV